MDHLDVDKKNTFEHHEGGSIDQEDVIQYVPGTAEEKALVRKVDKRLLPILWLMYIFNYIDRTNIGVSDSVVTLERTIGADEKPFAAT